MLIRLIAQNNIFPSLQTLCSLYFQRILQIVLQTVLFYQNSSDSVNVSSYSIKNFVTSPLVFKGNPDITIANSIRDSLEVSNDTPIVGNTSIPSADELRYRAYAEKSAQLRSVTRNDYEAMMYLMPSKFGSVKRASVVNDPSSSNRRLSIYVVSSDTDNNLIQTNATIKQNLKTWINNYKPLNDNIDIYDVKIINIGFDYEIKVDPTLDRIQVLQRVQARLKEHFVDKMYVGEPFYLSSVFSVINKVRGVLDTIKVTPVIKSGENYSIPLVTIDQVKSKDGLYLSCPKNAIYEIKIFDDDVRGSTV